MQPPSGPSQASPAASKSEAAPVELSREQSALAAILAERDRRFDTSFADMLVGALTVLRSSVNPDRVPQAAHSIRDLLDKLPEHHSGIPVRVRGAQASVDLRTIAEKLAHAQDKSPAYRPASEDWDGQVDPILSRFLREVSGIVAVWRNRPNQKDKNRSFIQQVHTAGPLTAEQEDDFANAWSALYRFFVKTCHHDSSATVADVLARIDECCVLLLRILRAPTFLNLDALDAIIKEGESNA